MPRSACPLLTHSIAIFFHPYMKPMVRPCLQPTNWRDKLNLYKKLDCQCIFAARRSAENCSRRPKSANRFFHHAFG